MSFSPKKTATNGSRPWHRVLSSTFDVDSTGPLDAFWLESRTPEPNNKSYWVGKFISFYDTKEQKIRFSQYTHINPDLRHFWRRLGRINKNHAEGWINAAQNARSVEIQRQRERNPRAWLWYHQARSKTGVPLNFMWVKQCYKPPMTGNGKHTTHKNGDDWMIWGMVYGIVLPTL